MINKQTLISSAFCSLYALSGIASNPERPLNVVLITADDLNYSSVGYTGCQVPEITPNLDQLASEGVVFQNAYVNIAVSQPSRAVLSTGLYSHHSGVRGFYHTEKDMPTVMSVLRDHGYQIGIAGKLDHSTPVGTFQWDTQVDQPDLGDGRDPKRYYEVFNEFVRGAKEKSKPFYFMFNAHDPHTPFHGSAREKKMYPHKRFPDASRVYTPDEIVVPDFVVDTPESRIELAQYYSSVRRMDDVVGQVMRVLKEQNVEENTLLMFLSDNGMDFPFAKTNCYYNSNRTPWLVKWPGVVKPGTIDKKNFIASIDFMPTVLDACGIRYKGRQDGKSFVEALKGKRLKGENRVYTQFYETAGRNSFPMFAVHDGDYCYIFNAWSDGERIFKNCTWAGMTFASMEEESKNNSFIRERLDFFKYRTLEEFYDVKNDQACLHNLIHDKTQHKMIEKYRGYLKKWMQTQHSPFLPIFEQRDNQKYRISYVREQQAKARKKIPETVE